ncbi:hypothetical protein HPB52_011552 [Rhipicephalus sanguineus]|uniref:GH18 domain-containing protein n=1 Tax=Rhipicephalus sanguineus TaxID=34632 RepID=A0A9D4SQ81_RHISA|nr:hypothetical protein HPB52_011552 [Rhipicephalus sanguineus]
MNPSLSDSGTPSHPASRDSPKGAHATMGVQRDPVLAATAAFSSSDSSESESSPDAALAAPVVREISAAPAETHEVVVAPSSARPTGLLVPEVPVEEPGENETPQDDRYCIAIWVTGAALTFPLVVAVWLLLVPFMVHTNMTIAPMQPDPTVALVRTTAIDPWKNTPPKCLVPAALPSVEPPLSVGPPYTPNTTDLFPRPIFCLFNNTRVNPNSSYHNPRWHYVFEALPFDLCTNVVYWSVGIENGDLTSRLPAFDVQYGLYKLRNVTNALNYPDTKILLTLGGYAQDAPHFSRLGRDKDVLDDLIRNVMSAAVRYGLSGVTVHWTEPSDDCRGPKDRRVLEMLLRRLRASMDSRLPGSLVTVILEPGVANERFAHDAADAVDHFFLATQHVLPTDHTNLRVFCESVTLGMHDALRRLADALVPPKLRRSQLCLTDSVLPFLLKGSLDVRLRFTVSPNTDVARVPVYWGCNRAGVCRNDALGYSCFMHVIPNVTTGAFDDWVFMTSQVNELQRRLSWTKIGLPHVPAAPDDPPHACVLLLDFDGDNFVDQCHSSFSRYAFANHFYFGSLGHPLFNGSLLDAFARC